MAISQKLQERIRSVAAELRQEVYGTSGVPQWGTKFTEIEDVGVEIGDALACELIGQSLQGQASKAEGAGAQECTVCGRSGKEDGVEPRLVRTRRGEVPWRELKGYCRHCRKAFFPQSEALGVEPDASVSPRILQKMVYAGTHATSFPQAERDLEELAEAKISAHWRRREDNATGPRHYQTASQQTAL